MARLLTPGLERRLRAESVGEILFDRFSRGRYATDASQYQIVPLGVVVPRTVAEAERAIAVARAEGVPVTLRGGGTSQCGQTINDGLIVDCSKHLTRILELDVANRRCVVEPGIVLDELNRQLRPHGLWFPIDVSTASRATIGGMAGNNSCGGRSLRYGTMRDNVLSIDAVLPDGTPAHFGPRRGRCFRPARRATSCASARARRTRWRRASPRCSAASAATISTRSRPTRAATISRTSWSGPKERSPSRRGSS